MKYILSVIITSVLFLQSCKEDDGFMPKTLPLLRSYESTSGAFSQKATYEYNSDDKVTQIEWERATPGITRGKDVFLYDAKSRLTTQVRSITGLVDETIEYTWDDDKIFAARTFSNGQKIAFSFYDYNNKDQLETMETYNRQGNFGYLRTDSIGFSYHSDGNLFKMFNYAYSEAEQHMILVSTKIFPDYLSSPCPVSTIEVLPVVSLQKNLPSQYTWQGIDNNVSYVMQYELRDDGYPSERTVTSNAGTELTKYEYQE
jgi:hypothetical protein